MNYYVIKMREMPWGDYGSILLIGMSGSLERRDKLLQYQRTGPFQPDLTLSGFEDLLVTESTKNKVQQSDLQGFSFRPVIKQHIVFLDWTSWSTESEDPPYYPEGGAPENYIWSLPHSQELADSMENVWEVVVETNGTWRKDDTFEPIDDTVDIMRADNKGYFIVTERAKSWIEQNCRNWTEFEPIKVASK